MGAPQRPSTAQAFALAEIRRAILARDLRPGEAIRQDALAERLGVSRVPLREALKILEGERQITYEPHRGYSVAELSLDDLREVYRIRQLLEREATTVAARRLTTENYATLVSIQHDIEDATITRDLPAIAAADQRFHFVLFEFSNMPRLVWLIRLLWDTTAPYRSLFYGADPDRARVNREHRAVLEALRRNNVERVVKLLDEHRGHAVRWLEKVFGEEDLGSTPR